MKLPVDTSAIAFLCALAPEPVIDFQTPSSTGPTRTASPSTSSSSWPWATARPTCSRSRFPGRRRSASGRATRSRSPAREAGLPKIRLHDVRHSYASAALAAGIPAKIVSEPLGHATIQITLDTYSHVLPGLDAQAAETVARLILGDGSGSTDVSNA
jgi:Phage integrase family